MNASPLSFQASLVRALLRLAMKYFARQARRQAPGDIAPGQVSIEAARRFADWSARAIRAPRDVRIQPARIDELPARWIIPPVEEGGRVLLYLHGGAWVYGWSVHYDAFVARLAGVARARALGIDYRLAPGRPFPAAPDDCLSAYTFLLDLGIPPGRVVVIGDSAGGNLALALLLRLKERGMPLPAGGVCLSPVTDLHRRGDSYRANQPSDVMLPAALVDYGAAAYAAGRDLRDPHISPVYGDLSGLPPLLVQAGGGEILLDDARALASRAAGCGVDVTLSITPGIWHVWQLMVPLLPEANRAVAEIARFVRSRPA